MLRLASLLLVLLIAFPARAQEADPEGVMLQGWALPEGSSITSTSQLLRRAEVRFFAATAGTTADTTGDAVRVLSVYTRRDDSLRSEMLEVDDAGPRKVDQFVMISDILEDVHEGEEIVERGRRANPLSGTRFILERAEDGSWSHRFVRPEEPSDEEIAALSAARFDFRSPQYPERPVQIGEEWNVDRDALVSMYGELAHDAEQRMTLRLDSTGTFMDRPVAYLSYGLDVTLQPSPDVRMHRREHGVVVRRLDLLVDVYEQRQGYFSTERAPDHAAGQPYSSVMSGSTQSETQRLLTVPATGLAAPAAARP